MKKEFLYIFIILILNGCVSNTKSIKPKESINSSYSFKKGKKLTKEEVKNYCCVGIASYYGKRWHGRLTANGERLNINALTAAHKSLPFNTFVKVTDLETGKSVIVRINDRGPYIKGRIIDLTDYAAKKLGILEKGIAKVRVEVCDKKS